MFCGNCGKQIDDNALSCPYCNWVVTVMPNIDSSSKNMSAEKQILIISERVPELTLAQIIANTSLEMNEAEDAIKNLIAKGFASETVNSSGQTIYTFMNEAYKKLQEKREKEGGGIWAFIIIAIVIFIIFKCSSG